LAGTPRKGKKELEAFSCRVVLGGLAGSEYVTWEKETPNRDTTEILSTERGIESRCSEVERIC
jgi:hypothetical protein